MIAPRVNEMTIPTVWLALGLAAASGCGGRTEFQATSQASAGQVGTGGASGAGTGGGPTECTCRIGAECDANACVCSKLVCGGRCVDPQVDDAHCGACGLTCATGCKRGRCIEVLASGLRTPTALAQGRTELYWTTTIGLMKVSKTGGSPSIFVPGNDMEGLSRAIAVDDTYVYWSGRYDSTVMRASTTTGIPEVLAENQGDVSNIVFDAAAIYWSDWQKGTIMTAPKAGGSPRALTTTARFPKALAVDSGRIYWTEDVAQDGAVKSMPLAGGAPLTLASGQDSPRGMGIDATHVFWTLAFDASVRRAPLGGGKVEVLSKSSPYPEHLLVDDRFLYWVSSYDVEKVGLDGGDAESLPGTEFPSDLALDENSVYFINDGAGGLEGNGTLIKLTPK